MGLDGALRRVRRRPWANPALGGSWRECRFSVVDIETTGLDLARDDIVSIGAVRVAAGRITSHTFYEVAKPRRPISSEAMKVHALTSSDVAAAPPAVDVLARLRDFAVDSTLVAHAAWIERSFIDRALKPLGERLADDLIDTAAIARATLDLDLPAGGEPSLEALATTLGLPVHTPHHALGDALTTAQVLLVLAARHEVATDAPVTGEDLLGLSSSRKR